MKSQAVETPDFTLTVALAQSAEHRNVDTMRGPSEPAKPRASECRTVPSAAPESLAKVPDKVSAGAPSRTWRLTPQGYASQDPTTRASWMVKGELDVGPQRRCVVCRQWWPVDSVSWVVQTKLAGRRVTAHGRSYIRKTDVRTFLQPCKACRVENGMADS